MFFQEKMLLNGATIVNISDRILKSGSQAGPDLRKVLTPQQAPRGPAWSWHLLRGGDNQNLESAEEPDQIS